MKSMTRLANILFGTKKAEGKGRKPERRQLRLETLEKRELLAADMGVDLAAAETPSTIVTTLTDVVDDTDNLISLREAIEYAGTGSCGTTITFDSSLAGGTSLLELGEFSINKSLTIDGGNLGITLDAQNNSRFFYIAGEGSESTYVTIAGLRMTNGCDSGWDGGGAIHVEYANLTLSGVTIENSYADNYGGGFYAGDSNVTVLNSLIAGNKSQYEGAGFYNSYSTVTVIGSTLSGNRADEWGDGDAFYNDGTVELKNCIVVGNDSGFDSHAEMMSYDTINAYYVLTASENFDSFSDYAHCVAYDSSKELFVDASNGDYSLTSNSQAKNVGNNDYASGISTDVAGWSRIAFETVDMGAYEYHTPLTGVAISGTANIGETLTAAVSPDGATKTYQWYRGETAISGATSAAYTIVSADAGYALTVKASGTGNYGGTVSETTAPVAGAETPSTVVTTLLDVVDKFDNLISIREAITYAGTSGLGTTVTFDSSLAGGTIYLEGTQLSIAKSLTIDGGALGITLNAGKSSEAGSSSKTHTNRVVYIAGTESAAIDVTLNGLTITGGLANNGSGIYSDGTLTITNSTIAGNTASRYGGGIFVQDGIATITNSLVSDNGGDVGGGIYMEEATTRLTITNSTIAGNTASRYGGGIYVNEGTLTLKNSIVAKNTAEYGDDVFSSCDIKAALPNGGEGMTPNGYGGGELNAYNVLSSYSEWTAGSDNLIYDSSKALFVDASNGDYSLTSDSQAKDVGNNDYAAGIATDFAGNSRIAFGTVDMGAYEYHLPLTGVSISGTAKIGETLTAAVSPDGATVTYQWYRGETAISGATSAAYTVALADVGYALTVKVSGTGNYGGTVSETTAEVPTIQLATPGNFAAAEITDSSMSVSWDEVENASGYSVEYKKTGEENWNVVLSSATSLIIDGLNRNTEYQLRVKAVGVSPYGDSEYATASATTAKTALTSVSISGDAHVGKTLTATVGPDGATANYKWYRQGVADPIATGATYSPVAADIGYTLTVEAAGTGDYAGTVSETTAPVILPETPSTVVTTLEDVVDLGDAKISLREAINYAGTGSCGLTITFDSSLAGGTIYLENGFLTIEYKSLTIDGGTLGITIDGQNKSRVFSISGEGADVTYVTISGLRMTNGHAPQYIEREGGALFAAGVDLTLNGVTMENCYAANGGGGFNVFNSNVTVLNSLIANNRSGDEGGAFYNWSSNVTLINSTLTGNYSEMDADQPAGDCFKVFSFDDPASVELKNCIVVNNKAPNKNHSEIVRVVGAAAVQINAYRILTAQTNIDSSFDTCVNCVAYDSSKALFVDAANGDYSLTSNSQAKDKGNNDYASGISTDIAGWSRIAFGTVDMGAYEYHLPLTGVSISGTAKVGETLTASVSPDGATAAYQWYRGDEAISGATSATYTIVSADAGYALTVKASGTGNYAGTVSETTAVVPANKLATPRFAYYGANGKNVKIVWHAVKNADGYILKYSTDPTLSEATTVTLTTTGQQLEFKLADYGDYYYTLQATDSTGHYAASEPTSAKLQHANTLATPEFTNFKRTSLTSISMAWNAVEDADYYLVYYSTDNFATDPSVKVVRNATSYNLTGLTPGETYSVKLVAKNNAPEILASSVVRQTEMVLLGTPAIKSIAVDGKSVTLTLNTVLGANRYVVFYAQNAEMSDYKYKTLDIDAETVGEEVTITIDNLSAGTYYFSSQSRDTSKVYDNSYCSPVESAVVADAALLALAEEDLFEDYDI